MQFITFLYSALHVSGVDTHHQQLQHNINYVYIYIVIYFVVHNLKILLLTIHHYFIYIFIKASNIHYNQSRILNYTLVLIPA